jgi:hypothetical protein
MSGEPSLKTHYSQRNDTAHQHPAGVPRPSGNRIRNGSVRVDNRLTGERLHSMVAELKQIGLGAGRGGQIEPVATPRLLKRRGHSG